MKEAVFISELMRSFSTYGDIFMHKITDMPHFKGMKTRFDRKKPFDMIGTIGGIPIAIEAKMIKKVKGFGFRDIKPHQIEALNDFHRAGGRSFVFLNVRQPRIKDVQKAINSLIVFNGIGEIQVKQLKKEELEYRMNLIGIKGYKGKFDILPFIRSWLI